MKDCRFLTVDEVVRLHDLVIRRSGGSGGVRDFGAIEAAVAQPRMTFAGEDLYPSLVEKSGALAFSLVRNHPFIDGNKRIGHAAMEVFLVLNGYQIDADVDVQEQVFLDLAAGSITRDELVQWIERHITPI